uniref:Uncharacterized protein n=1 Tax=Cucumis melo TaxID=3656 RepID=A0A9I9EME9_CUCME
MIPGPRIQSSPLWPGGKASPDEGSTILASIFSDRRPTELALLHSSGPTVLDAAPALSVNPYPYSTEQNHASFFVIILLVFNLK